LAILINGCVAFIHRLLDGDCAFDRVHDAGKFRKYAVARGVNDTPGMGADYRSTTAW
jgi:hypothetical protein